MSVKISAKYPAFLKMLFCMLVQAYFYLIQVSQLILQQNQEISIISLNYHPFSDRISITLKHSKTQDNLHIMVTLTLFVRVRILLRLPPKKQLFVRKAAFFITFCSLLNFQIFHICQTSVKWFFEPVFRAVKQHVPALKVLTSYLPFHA